MAKNTGGKVIQMLSPENYIRKKALTLPLYECLINDGWNISQMAQLSVARQHTNGNVTVCFYLVDLLCLGVKDTHYMFNIPLSEYREQIEQINEKMTISPISYKLTHNIVFAGIEFAEEYGFKPHKDFTSITRFMLEEDTEDIELIEIECGMSENPVYSRGPNDTDVKVQRILAQLEKTAGPGNYTYMDGEDFDEDEDVDEFENISFDEKRKEFLILSKRLIKLTNEESRRFVLLVNSLADDLIDYDRYDELCDVLYEELNIETDEINIPDQLLGISPGDQIISENLKTKFIHLYNLIREEKKLAAKELKLFEKDSNGLPCVYLLELLQLQIEESRKYPKRLKEYALKYPDYPVIRLLWMSELVTSGKDLHEIPEYPFKIKTFFPDREIIHPIERQHFLMLHIFVAAIENDLNKIEALYTLLDELNLAEDEAEVLGTIILMIKVNYLLALFTINDK